MGGFFYLIKQRRLVSIHFLQNRPHERLTDEAALVRDTVFLAETIQRPDFGFVEQDGYLIFAGLFFQWRKDDLKINGKLCSKRYYVSTRLCGILLSFNNRRRQDRCLLKLSIKDSSNGCFFI